MEYRNVKPTALLDKWCVHAYYTICPWAPDGSGRLLFAAADLDTKTNRIYVADKDGKILHSFAESACTSSFWHTGRFQTWSPDAKYVYYQGGTVSAPLTVKHNIETGEEFFACGNMEGAPPFGEPIIGGAQGMLYAAGYGTGCYRPEESPYPFGARDKHGLFRFHFGGGREELVLSAADVLAAHPKRDELLLLDKEMQRKLGGECGLTLMCYCVRYNMQGNRFLFYFGNHCQARKEPKISYVFTCNADFTNLRLAVDMCGASGYHFSWHPDGERLIGYGPHPKDRKKACLVTVNYDGSDYRVISDHNAGHPSVCPTDYDLIASDDRIEVNGKKTGRVVLICAQTGKIEQEYFIENRNNNEETSIRNEHWVCHHPVFDRDGKRLLVNSLSGRNACLLEIKL